MGSPSETDGTVGSGQRALLAGPGQTFRKAAPVFVLRVRRCGYTRPLQTLLTRIRRPWLDKGYVSLRSVCRTLEGIETVSIIREDEKWVSKDDVKAQVRFLTKAFGIAA